MAKQQNNDQQTVTLTCKSCKLEYDFTRAEIKQGFTVLIGSTAKKRKLNARDFICMECAEQQS